MTAPEGYCANSPVNEPEMTVLVLTDGSDQAERVTEWGLMFVDVDQATIHHIEIVECLDWGVIIHIHDENVQNERVHPAWRPTDESADEMNQIQGHDPTIDVLHGVPHDALLDYVTLYEIDLIIIGFCDKTCPSRSFIGDTLTTVSHTTTIPVITYW